MKIASLARLSTLLLLAIAPGLAVAGTAADIPEPDMVAAAAAAAIALALLRRRYKK